MKFSGSRLLAACALLTVLLTAQPPWISAVAGQGSNQDPAPAATYAGLSPVDLKPGEKLEMEISWRPPIWLFFIPPISAGNITLEIKELIAGDTSPAIRITGDAKSSGTFNSLAGIRVQNHYESILDLGSFCSRQFKFMQREGKRMQDVEIDFDGAARKLRVRQWNATKNPRVETRNELIDTEQSCIQDLISIFYAVRGLQLQPGVRRSLALSNDHGRVQPIEASVDGEESIRTDAGNFQAWRITTSGLFGGLFRSGGEFKVWLDKTRHIPVKFDAKVKLGRVTGNLVSFTPGR